MMITKSMATLEFYDLGNAGQVTKKWEWRLRCDYGLTVPGLSVTKLPPQTIFTSRYYSLVWRDGYFYIQAHAGCAWDYATGYFDGDYIKEASLGHDILSWLINRGVIATKYNDAIDYEFKQILLIRGDIAPWRAALLMKAVNQYDSRLLGTDRPVIKLRKGKRVKT